MDNMYDIAKSRYAALGVDAEAAMKLLAKTPVSLHCWQGDDVLGFETADGALTGGIQTTGNYPGRARTPQELMADFDVACSQIPGMKRLNLHASYAITNGEKVDRDALEPKHFKPWVDYAKARGLGIDFNPTFFSHPKAAGLTLSSPDPEIRAFWVRHGIACRRISAYIAKELGSPCLCNLWIPDGLKDVPADRLSPRMLLKDSLDQIYAEKLDGVIDSVESKVFGIGLESYTVGSSEFYTSYAASRKDVYVLMDSGHYHPTELVSDKISAMLCFFDKLPLHVTRAVRWDSDHVVRFEDEIREIACEIVRNNALDRVLIGLDFFDASINRVAAWIIGCRSMKKALLYALLMPNERLQRLQREGKFTELLMLQEEVKTLPFGAIWEAYCERENTAPDERWFKVVEDYEHDVLVKRG